jgi:hypothetical protein
VGECGCASVDGLQNTHGNLNIANSFAGPSEDPWPQKIFSSKLGKQINRIRSSGTFVKSDFCRRQWLEDEGFVFDTLKEKREDAQRALEQCRDVHGVKPGKAALDHERFSACGRCECIISIL